MTQNTTIFDNKTNLKRVRDAVSIRRNYQICYREIKYEEGNPRRKCHLNYEGINDNCYHCKWYQVKTTRYLICTGKEIEGLVNFIHKFAPKALDHHKNLIDLNKELKGKSEQKLLEGEKIEGE